MNERSDEVSNREDADDFLFEMKSQDVDNFSVPQTNSQSNTQTTIPQQKKEEERG